MFSLLLRPDTSEFQFIKGQASASIQHRNIVAAIRSHTQVAQNCYAMVTVPTLPSGFDHFRQIQNSLAVSVHLDTSFIPDTTADSIAHAIRALTFDAVQNERVMSKRKFPFSDLKGQNSRILVVGNTYA